MANEFRVRKKLIVNGSGSTILDVQGSQGQLFSVTDSLSGSLFSVKDISGIPVIEAFSDDTVNIGTFNAEAIKVSGSFARITGSLLGTASWANNAVTSSYALTASVLLGSVVSSSYAATASVAINAATASYVPASAVVGLNLSQISSGSVTASVNTDISASFRITSGSNTLLNVTKDGFVWIGNGAFSNQGYQLDVQGSSRVGAYFSNGATTVSIPIDTGISKMYINASSINGPALTLGIDASGRVLRITDGTNIGVLDLNGGNIKFGTNTAGNVQFLVGGQTRATISSNYNFLIGTTTDVSSAILNTYSTTQGFLPTRTDLTSNISNPAQGLITYVTSSSTEGLYYYSSGSIKAWTRVLNNSGSQSISGSLTVSQGITGSLQGTASYALVAETLLGSVVSSSYAATASFAFTSSYAINMIVSGGLTDVDYIQFDTASTVVDAIGRLKYDSGEGTLQLGLAGGNVIANIGEDLYQYVYNNTGTSLTKGQVVYISGSQGNRVAVKLASATAEIGSANTLGFTAETIAIGAEGWIQTEGSLRKINTSGLIAGFPIYLSSSAGQYTQTRPIAPNHTVTLGFVERVDATVGSIYVKIDNGYELGELHNVIDSTNTGSYGDLFIKSGSVWINSKQLTGSYGITGSLQATSFTGSLFGTASYALDTPISYIDNLVTVGLVGSDTQFNSIKAAVDSITDASADNTYTVRVYPGVYIEDTITMKSYIAVKGDSSTSTVVSASNPSASIFVMADQTMVIDMQIQGSTGPGASAIYYSSPTTPQTNAIAYAENVRFGTNYTNASCIGSGSGNCILQCSNVKYGGSTDASLKSFDIGFRVSGSGGNIGRMQLRNVTSTNGGVAGTDNNQIFALAEAPGCTFIVNGCLLTRATGAARGTGFKVYNGGQLRLTAVNFQRWINGIWAPQTGSAPSIDAIALNFENCTTDVLIEHTGSIGKVSGTDNFLKTQIALAAPLYEVGQDPRRITVGTKGADFTSISASVAWISGSNENNRYVIEVGPGQFIEKTIDLTGKPYVSIVGSNIQTTQVFPSSSTQHIFKMGVNNELSFLSLANAGSGYSGIYVDNVGDFAQVHKVSIYDCDRGITVLANSEDTQFYAEYVDINGTFTYGAYISSSNGASVSTTIENYYLFPSASATIGNFVTGPSSSLSLYTAKFLGDGTTDSTAIKLENGAQLEGAAIDIQDWDYGYVVPNIGTGPNFRVVGSMVHDSSTYDFDIQNATLRGRYQGVSDHSKINNISEDFYWNFLDDADGENDVTRKLSVTFADGTHTDATTLIFRGSPMGVLQGGEITISGSLTVTTATGFGYLHDPINVEVFKRFDWVDGDITLSPNTNNYIYINSNGILSAAGSTPNYAQNIILGRVVTNDTGIEFIDQSPWNAEHTANAISKFNREALGPVFADGSIVTEDATPFKLDVTQGSYFFSENNFLPVGTSSINLTQYYQSASVWARYTSSVVPNNVYASGSALVPMSASYYTKHTVYLVGDGADEEYFLVVNNNQYSSLVSTENASLPTTPTYFNDGVVPLAAVYVQSGSANITQIQDIRPIIGFRAAGVNASSVHGNLLGLTADDHLQYLRVDGFREMSGDLGLGGNNLYNVASVSASAITSSEASITNIIAVSITGSLFGNATSADFATSASFTSTASLAISSSYAVTASRSISSSFASTSSLALNFFTGSVTSASFASTASLALNFFTSSVTSASFARTSSLALSFFTSSVTSASFASTASLALSFFTSSVTSASYAATASAASNFVVGNSITASNALIINTITAQTLVVQTITASVEYSSGSNIFGSVLINTHQFTGSVTITGSLSVVGQVSASGFTGSLLGTSSWARNSLTASYFFTSSVTSASFASTASYFLTSSVTSASFASTASLALNFFTSSVTSASFASTSSWANNFFTSSVTSASFASTASYFFTSSVTSASFASTASFVSTASWANNFFTSSVTSASFASTSSLALNFFTGSVTSASFARTSSLALNFFTASVTSASFASTASLALNFFTGSVTSASFASTASFVNTLNQNVLITGSLTIGTSSLGATENTLILGPAPAGGAGEGGQILLQAKGDSGYTSASMLDNWQNQTRLLRGSNQSSDAIVTQWDMHTKQVSFPAYNSVSAFAGTAVANLAVDNNGNILTVSTSGGTVFPYTGTAIIDGGLIVTGSITSTAVIYAQANGGMYFQGGDDAALHDINVANTMGIFGLQDSTIGSIKLGSGGGIISGRSGSIGIGTTLPVSGTLHVEGNVFAASLTGSLLGTASWAQNFFTSSVTSASFASTASLALNFFTSSVTSASFARTSSLALSFFTGSVTSASFASTASLALNFFTSSVTSASFASTASYFLTSSVTSASFASTASLALNFFTSSVTSASFARTASLALSFFTGSVTSASFASTASYFLTSSVTSASYAATASISVSSSYALTASYALNGGGGGGGLTTKAGSVANSSFTGNPKKATVTFSTAFATTNYAITVTGEDARSWTIESKVAGSFVISANSNTALAGTTYWIATAYGETT